MLTIRAGTLATPLDTSKFHLVFLDVNNSMLQLHKMTNSELVSTEQVTVTARAIPVPNKSIYAGYSYITSDFLGAVDIAMTGGGRAENSLWPKKWIW